MLPSFLHWEPSLTNIDWRSTGYLWSEAPKVYRPAPSAIGLDCYRPH
jgi:hypothetical protein